MPKNKKKIAIFKKQKIRRVWDEKKETWYFSVIDIISVLTNSSRPRKYWNDLKRELNKEGAEVSEKIGQLKLESSDGKKYLTDVADTQTIRK